MMQILKLAFSARPPLPKEAEPAADPLDASFAGCLAQASAPPSGARPPEPDRPSREKDRPETAESVPQTAGASAQAPAAPEESLPEKSPDVAKDTRAAEAPAEPSPRPQGESFQAAPLPAIPETIQPAMAGLPAPAPALPAPVQASQVAATDLQPSPAATTQAPTVPAAPLPEPPATAAAGNLSMEQAQQALAKIAPGVELRFQPSEGMPELLPSSKPALTELMALPRPEMDIPLPADPGFRTALGKPSLVPEGTVAPQVPTTPKPVLPQVVVPAASAPVQEAIQLPLPEAGTEALRRSATAPVEAKGSTRLEPKTAPLPEHPAPLVEVSVKLPRLAAQDPFPAPAQPSDRRRVETQESPARPRPGSEAPEPAPKPASETSPAPSERPVLATASPLKDSATVAVKRPVAGGEAPPAAGWVSASPSLPAAGKAIPTPVSAQATFAQVEGGIRWLLKHQQNSAEIHLHPESLGRVVVKLRVEGGEVHARMWASEASTVPLLQDQRQALEASLRQQGLSLGSFDLHQGHRGHDAHTAQHPPRFDSGADFAQFLSGKQEVPIPLPIVLDGTRLIEVIA